MNQSLDVYLNCILFACAHVCLCALRVSMCVSAQVYVVNNLCLTYESSVSAS